MSIINSVSIIVTSCLEQDLLTVYQKAEEIFTSKRISMLSPKSVSGYQTFFISPDGNKDECKKRIKFTNWLEFKLLNIDWVAVQFGNGKKASIVNSN